MPLIPPSKSGELFADRYEIVRVIGRGGYADVYLARDLQEERSVAVKIMHAALRRNKDALIRFQREAQLQGKIRHSHVAKLYDCGITRVGQPYLVVELVEGRSLLHHLRTTGAFSVEKIQFFALQILSALTAVHYLGVLHRDLKPGNLILCKKDPSETRMVLIDFGFATFEGISGITAQGHVVGSLSYIAPERLMGHDADERSDLYSLGIVLYEALTGRPPFCFDADAKLIQAHLEIPPTAPSTIVYAETGKKISSALDRGLLHLLEKDPKRRPQSASEMAASIKDLSL